MFFFIYVMLLSLKVTATPLPFVEMAKHDPAVLVDLLDTADPDAVASIITLLEKMMTNHVGTIQYLNKTLAEKEKVLKTAELDESEQAGKCGKTKVDLEEKISAQKVALGVLTGAQATRAEDEPKLTKELKTLRTVLEKVKSLQTSSEQKKSRRLLALDSVGMSSAIKSDPEAFLESLVDANPQKLQLVINLIEELIAEAEKQLAHVIQVEKDALEKNKIATEAVHKARQVDGTCKKQLGEKRGDVAEITGERDTAKLAHDTRVPILLSENAILQEIIDLLKPLAKKD